MNRMLQAAWFLLSFKIRTTGRFLSDNCCLRVSYFLILSIFFVVISRLILSRGYIVLYAGISIWAIYLNFNYRKAEFYRQQFSGRMYYLAAITECLLLALPFTATILLFSKTHRYFSLCPIGFCVLFPMIALNKFAFSGRAIPSPYPKESYEFNYGFRLLIFLYFACITLLIIGAFVGNVNLFVVSSISIVCLTSFSQNRKFIGETCLLRMYKRSSNQIIISKIKQGATNMLLLTAPIALASAIDVANLFVISAVVVGLGAIYYAYSTLCRFTFIHFEILNVLAQIVSLALFTSIPFFPPLLAVVFLLMCLLYSRTVKNLETILND